MANPVVHFEITGKDAQKSAKFYSGIFDWKVDANNPMNYGMVDTAAGSGIGGGIAQGETPMATFYVQVADPQAYLDKAVSLGGTVVAPVTEVPEMVTFALFSDPDGNVVGLVKGE